MRARVTRYVNINFLVVLPHIFYNSIGQELDRFINIPRPLTNRITVSSEDELPKLTEKDFVHQPHEVALLENVRCRFSMQVPLWPLDVIIAVSKGENSWA